MVNTISAKRPDWRANSSRAGGVPHVAPNHTSGTMAGNEFNLNDVARHRQTGQTRLAPRPRAAIAHNANAMNSVIQLSFQITVIGPRAAGETATSATPNRTKPTGSLARAASTAIAARMPNTCQISLSPGPGYK